MGYGGYGHGGMGGGGGGGGGDYGYHPIEAAIYSNHKVDVIPVASHKGYPKPTYVDVPSGVLPVYINFQSQSSPVYVKQKHYGMSGSYQHSHSYDEPHHLKHVVTKPVIQEVNEVITPYRKITQTIKPVSILLIGFITTDISSKINIFLPQVHEEVMTLVHKNAGYGGGYGGGMNGKKRGYQGGGGAGNKGLKLAGGGYGGGY